MKAGWEVKRIKDLVEKTTNIKWSDHIEGFNYIDLSSVSRDTLKITDTTKVNAKNAPSRAKKIVKSGDVIFATTRPTLNRVTIIDKDYHNQICSTGYSVLRPKQDKLLAKYLFYFIRAESFMKVMESLQRGASYPAVTDSDVKSVQIPIPPLPEQRAIVAKLDAAFAGIAQARANIERNIQNAEELFQSKLNAVFAGRGEGWEKYSLQDVSQSITDGDHQPPPKTNKGIPFITISNINKQSRKIDFSETYYVAEEYFNKIKDTRKPQKGDILYTVTGSFGIPVLLDFDKRFCFQRHIGLIKPNSLIDSKFLYYWILSPSAYSQACKLAKGTAQKTVSLKSLRSMFVFVPQRGEQEKIAKQLDEFSSEIEFIRSVLNNKIRALDDLQQSILQRAFSGQLTENEVAV